MTEAADKTVLRTEVRGHVRAIDPRERAEASDLACRRLAELPAWSRAATIMLYVPLRSEVDTTPLALECFREGRTVCVPRVDWDRGEMHPVETTSFEDEALVTDERNLRTPTAGRPVVPASIDLVVVPGLAFDPDGGRLGRGGGFYDRFLARTDQRTLRIGIAFDAQIVPLVPREPHDVLMDAVVTDRRLLPGRRMAAAG